MLLRPYPYVFVGMCIEIVAQASTSELFGLIRDTPQTEKTPFYPRSPYCTGRIIVVCVCVCVCVYVYVYVCVYVCVLSNSKC